MYSGHFCSHKALMTSSDGINVTHSLYTPHVITDFLQQYYMLLESCSSLRGCLGKVWAVRHTKHGHAIRCHRLPIVAEEGSDKRYASYILRKETDGVKRRRADNQ